MSYTGNVVKRLEKYIEEAKDMTTFPRRVWEPYGNGWASRTVMIGDIVHRAICVRQLTGKPMPITMEELE